MPIAIPHRFIERLLPDVNTQTIRTLIIGTFNPGEVQDLQPLPPHQHNQLQLIYESSKYRRFAEVLNYYDRPSNRFWGIMDRLHQPRLYSENASDFQNINGLKHYKGANRQQVFARQQAFCHQHGIFITDFVREIQTDTFTNVYNNFKDMDIDPLVSTWNTPFLLQVIQQYQPQKVILNVNESRSIPRISEQIRIIKDTAGDSICPVSSTSGSAAGTYEELVREWAAALGIQNHLAFICYPQEKI